MINDHCALSIAAEMEGLLRYFPANGLEAVAGLIRDLCPTEEIARMLLARVIAEYDDWPGPSSLKRIATELKGGARPDHQRWQPAWKGKAAEKEGWRKAVCRDCGDFGNIFNDRAGRYERCRCHLGEETEQSFLDSLNKRVPATRAPSALGRMTEEERARVNEKLARAIEERGRR